MLSEIAHHALGAPLRQAQVVVIVAAVVAMGSQFDGDIRIFLEHICQTVQCCRRFGRQVRFVKFIKDIAHQYGNVDARQGKLENVLVLHFEGIGMKIIAEVQVTLAGGQQEIIHARSDSHLKRTIGFHREFFVRAIIAHDINKGFRQFIAVLFIYPSFDGLKHLGIGKRVYLVPTSTARTAVGRKVTAVVPSLEGDSEVIGGRVHRGRQVNHCPVFGNRILLGAVKVKSTE